MGFLLTAVSWWMNVEGENRPDKVGEFSCPLIPLSARV